VHHLQSTHHYLHLTPNFAICYAHSPSTHTNDTTVFRSGLEKKTRIIKHAIIRFLLQRHYRIIQYSLIRRRQFKTIHSIFPPANSRPIFKSLSYFIWYLLLQWQLKYVSRVGISAVKTNMYRSQRKRHTRSNRRFSKCLWLWLINYPGRTHVFRWLVFTISICSLTNFALILVAKFRIEVEPFWMLDSFVGHLNTEASETKYQHLFFFLFLRCIHRAFS
jgi:hypothetical protein